MKFQRCLEAAAVVVYYGTACHAVSFSDSSKWGLGNGYQLAWSGSSNQIVIVRNGTEIWSTAPQQNFLSASSGHDTIVGEGGNFKITPSDQPLCRDMNVTKLEYQYWENSLICHSVAVKGVLGNCDESVDGSIGGSFSANFWVPKDLPDRVAFQIDVTSESGSKNELTRVVITYKSSEDEDFYGLGAQASFASLKNQSIPIFSREQGMGRGDEPNTMIQNLVGFFAGGDKTTTYTAIPQYISTKANAFYLSKNATNYANFDFTHPDSVSVKYDGLSVSGQLLQAESMLDAISAVADYTGKMRPLPKWVDEGAVIGIQGGETKVEKVVKEARSADCPVVGVWLQDWTGTRLQSTPTGINISRLWWNWESDTQLYPDWPKYVQRLQDQYSLRTLSYINPFVADVSSKPDGHRRNLFEEAGREKYMILNKTTGETSVVASGPGIEAGILDLTNDKARSWFSSILATQVWNANISGYMCDFGEYTPVTPDTGLSNWSSSALAYHNVYPRQWAELQQDFIRGLSSSRADDAVIFHRSASMCSITSMNLFWAGDQGISWDRNDGIKSVITILGHMGISGYAHSHSDIGGYTSTFVIPNAQNPQGAIGRTEELLGRWGELGAVSSAVFRTHEGNIPQINAQSYTNSSTLRWFSYNARLFKALAPYRRYVLDNESAVKGWPLLRLPVLLHPDDRRARQIGYESFYLGSDLYVAPVVDAGVSKLQVYLPGSSSTTYTHVWSDVTYRGGSTVTVEAPFGKPAIFWVNHTTRPELNSLMDFVREERNTTITIG